MIRNQEYDFYADWQPVSDGIMPDEGLYFITWEGKIGECDKVFRFIEMAEYQSNYFGDSLWDVSHIEAKGYHDIKVIAWMDLPDKWEGD